MLMLKAILKKCTSATIITKMDGVFESLKDSFETNMTSQEIKSLLICKLMICHHGMFNHII